MESSVVVVNDGKVSVVRPSTVLMECLGKSENAFVASSDDDREGTYRQLGIVMHLPNLVEALTRPCPRIGAFVVPSASVTKRVFIQGVKLM